MNMRERILAVIRLQDHDRVPFVQYDNIAAKNEEVWSLLGRDQLGLIRWSAVHRLEHPHCRFETEDIQSGGRPGRRTTLFTPAGTLTEERFFEPVYGSGSIRQHYVKDPEDYPVLLAYFRDVVVCEDLQRYVRDEQELGNDGLPMVAVARTPYQQLWVQWVGLQDLCWHRVDYSDLVEACIAELTRIEQDIFEVVRRAVPKLGIPFVNVPDNITAPVIGEALFRRYCVPLYQRLADMLAEWDVPVFVHMDGDLKPLWQAIGESGVGGLDSLSPPPDNDTSPGEAIAMWPKMRLFVNFPSSVHLAAPEKVYQQAARILAEAGHSGRITIQISENVPPSVWRHSFPQIVQAIQDFGKP